MNQPQVKQFLNAFAERRSRTIVIVDYGNVEKWKKTLHWDVGIRELAQLVTHLSFGNQLLRRFYYGADYGKNEKSTTLVPWSKNVLETARNNRFEIVNKRVKYIHDATNVTGFSKKCDLDVEMTVDLIMAHESYDSIILFSGDGDLMYAIQYLVATYQKTCYVFGARGHVGREVYDAKTAGYVSEILYAEDLEYRLNSHRWVKQ